MSYYSLHCAIKQAIFWVKDGISYCELAARFKLSIFLARNEMVIHALFFTIPYRTGRRFNYFCCVVFSAQLPSQVTSPTPEGPQTNSGLVIKSAVPLQLEEQQQILVTGGQPYPRLRQSLKCGRGRSRSILHRDRSS